MVLSQFVALLQSELDVQQTHLRLANKRSSLAPALVVAKLANVKNIILVKLCFAPKVRLRCSTTPPPQVSEQKLTHAKLQL
jgi:hypothetical protein